MASVLLTCRTIRSFVPNFSTNQKLCSYSSTNQRLCPELVNQSETMLLLVVVDQSKAVSLTRQPIRTVLLLVDQSEAVSLTCQPITSCALTYRPIRGFSLTCQPIRGCVPNLSTLQIVFKNHHHYAPNVNTGIIIQYHN